MTDLPEFPGWCCLWQTCGGVGVPCVEVRYGSMYCVSCHKAGKSAPVVVEERRAA